jgi:transposase-like protein
MGEKSRHFSREFKRDAVQLVTEKGMPVGKAMVHRTGRLSKTQEFP